MTPTAAALVVGAGDATGGAIARRFAREGMAACVTRRTADKLQPLVQRIQADGGQARAYAVDARDEAATAALVTAIEREVGLIEVAVFNIDGPAAVDVKGAVGLQMRRPELLISYTTCFVGNQMFFGQDRLDFVREALA